VSQLYFPEMHPQLRGSALALFLPADIELPSVGRSTAPLHTHPFLSCSLLFLLSYNLSAVKFIFLKSTVQWFWCISSVCRHHHNPFQNILSALLSPKNLPYSVSTHSHSPLTPASGSLLCLYGLPVLNLLYKWTRRCIALSWLFSLGVAHSSFTHVGSMIGSFLLLLWASISLL
jgi:hypothetical protein